MPTVSVSVTAGNIAHGERRTVHRCAGALAVRAAFPESRWVRFTHETITVGVGQKPLTKTYRTPPAARAFVGRFDAGAAVEPLTFELEG